MVPSTLRVSMLMAAAVLAACVMVLVIDRTQPAEATFPGKNDVCDGRRVAPSYPAIVERSIWGRASGEKHMLMAACPSYEGWRGHAL